MKRFHYYSHSYKGKHLIGAGLQLINIVMVGHGGVQANMVLEKGLRILHLDILATGSELYYA